MRLHPSTAPDLSRSDTRSFGVTHAKELSRINISDPAQASSASEDIPLTPPATQQGLPPPAPSHTSNGDVTSPALRPISSTTTSYAPPPGSPPLATRPASSQNQPPVMNPAALNQAPAPIPISSSAVSSHSPTAMAHAPAPIIAPDPTDAGMKVPVVTPTMAETGVPKTAGPEGPGPASGSLRDLKEMRQPSPLISRTATGSGSGSGGLAASESGGLPGYEGPALGGGSVGGGEKQWESAEDEKKRLEREERERVLAAGGSSYLSSDGVDATTNSGSGPGAPGKEEEAEDGELPPYREF